MYTPVAADVAKLRNTTGAGMMDREKSANAFAEYRVGFDNNWCIFWQCDQTGNYRSGTMIS